MAEMGGVTLLKFRQYYAPVKKNTLADGPFVEPLRSRFPDAFWQVMYQEGITQVLVQQSALRGRRLGQLDFADVKTLADIGRILEKNQFKANAFKEDGEMYIVDDNDRGSIPCQWES
jgi:hypothetical protein